MSHEIIHAVRNLGIITPKEYKTLVDAAKKRKYVFIADGKPIVRNYSYLDRAVEMNRHLTSDEKKAEEAVAELFRDWAGGKIKLVAQPKTIFGKIINAIKAIFNAHAKEGFTKAEQIFQNIVSTDKEKQIGARQRAGIKTQTKDRSALPKRFSDTPLKVDRPSGVDVITGKSYVQNKIEQNNIFKQEQIERGTDSDTYEINIGTSDGITGFIDGVVFKPEELRTIKGAKGEENFRAQGEKLNLLKQSIKKEGYKPQKILIHVREDGVPFIVEGNHRLAEAIESNRPQIKADIKGDLK